MKRTTRTEIANETVKIVDRGSYQLPDGRTVDVRPSVEACLNSTRLFAPVELERLRHDVLCRPATWTTQLEVVNETTLQGIARFLATSDEPVAVLNFASAKNPGGGFLNGSQAQEESLARSSALYASLLKAWPFYEQHRASNSMLYSDAMIWSPNCPIIRDDEGQLQAPQLASFITSPAPNAGAAATNRPDELPLIPEVLQRRAELVLALAAAHGQRRLILGAWGCGVFRNDPVMVAEVFASLLRRGVWAGRFERVLFSVLDSTPTRSTISAFERAIG